jgi:flagellin
MVAPVSGVTFNKLLNTINRNRSGLQNSMKRISSGRKQNRAARAQPCRERVISSAKISISAMTQSVSNVESGDSFVRTAEGRLGVVADLVNLGRELALQSSNGTLSDSQ